MFSRSIAAAAVAAVVVPLAATVATGADVDTKKAYDLDGDGRQELVIGVPWYAEDGQQSVGAVAVVDGAAGLLGDSRLLTRAQLGLGDDAKRYAATGSGLASGDFDGDGRTDLAVGSPGDAAIAVRYGGGRTSVLRDGGDDFSSFGVTLAAGDVDADGFADLVVADTAAAARADADYGSGAVRVLRGGADGLTTDRRSTIGRPDPANAAFGASLALGDVDGDERLDLLEGSPGAPEHTDDPPTPGHFTVTVGVAQRSAVTGQIAGAPESLAVGDVTGDGYDDVVLGIPVNRTVGEDGRLPAGVVVLHSGGKMGLDAAPIRITQDRRGVPGGNEAGDRFGSAVEIAHVDGDRYADIVVGARGENRGGGRVTIVRGARKGFARRGNTAFDQNTKGVPGRARASDLFGAAVTALDLDGDGRDDLAVAALGDRKGAGTITALRGSADGLAIKSARRLNLRRILGQAPEHGYGFPELRLGSVDGS